MNGNSDERGDGLSVLQTRKIDSSAVHPHCQEAVSLRNGESMQPVRDRGGPSTRIHAVSGGKGQPKAPILSLGRTANCTAAKAMSADIGIGWTLIAVKAYDRSEILDHLAGVGATAVNFAHSEHAGQGTSELPEYTAHNQDPRLFRRPREIRQIAARHAPIPTPVPHTILSKGWLQSASRYKADLLCDGSRPLYPRVSIAIDLVPPPA